MIYRALDSVSVKIGIIKQLNSINTLNGDPKCFNFSSSSAALNYANYKIKAGSCNLNEENAILGTIGESLERYCACFYNKKEQIVSDYDHIKKNAIHPSNFALFEKKQVNQRNFPFVEFCTDTELSWFPTRDLTTGLETYIPGQLLYMPFSCDVNIISPNVSTGLAAHDNIYDAILNGIYEVIERDSFVLSWYQRLPLKKIKMDEKIRTYIDRQLHSNHEIYLFDMTTDIEIPSVLALGFVENELGRLFVCGAATRWSYGEAIKKAIQEFIQGVSISRLQAKILADRSYEDFSDITTFDDHAWYYMRNPDTWGVFDQWICSNDYKKNILKEDDTLTSQQKILKIVDILATKKYNVCVKDITTVDVRQLGYYAVKVVIPQLLPLSGNYNYYFLGGERLYTVPEKIGFKSRKFENLNPFPHPFP